MLLRFRKINDLKLIVLKARVLHDLNSLREALNLEKRIVEESSSCEHAVRNRVPTFQCEVSEKMAMHRQVKRDTEAAWQKTFVGTEGTFAEKRRQSEADLAEMKHRGD